MARDAHLATAPNVELIVPRVPVALAVERVGVPPETRAPRAPPGRAANATHPIADLVVTTEANVVTVMSVAPDPPRRDAGRRGATGEPSVPGESVIATRDPTVARLTRVPPLAPRRVRGSVVPERATHDPVLEAMRQPAVHPVTPTVLGRVTRTGRSVPVVRCRPVRVVTPVRAPVARLANSLPRRSRSVEPTPTVASRVGVAWRARAE